MKKETIVNKLKDFDFRLDNEVLVENMENYITNHNDELSFNFSYENEEIYMEYGTFEHFSNISLSTINYIMFEYDDTYYETLDIKVVLNDGTVIFDRFKYEE